MHHHALNQAITLYRGEALTLEQASHHAGVSSGRMETALRSHNVAIRSVDLAPASDEAVTVDAPVVEPGPDSAETRPADAD